MTSHAAQQRVQPLLDELVASGREDGLQVAAYHRGRLIVDAWAGAVDGETLFPVYSTSKGIAATVVHVLAQRGLLRYDEPLAVRWPEFAAHGKERITLRHALAHLAGLPQMPEATLPDLADWDGMCARIAGLSPLWREGERLFYHAITYTWLIGEVACRATGRGFRQLVEDEICRPLGLEGSLFIGIADERYDRVAGRIARVVAEPAKPAPAPQAAPDPLWDRAIPPWVKPLEDWMNRPDAHRSCVPSSTGVMSARAVAKHYAALINDGVDGVRLLDAAMLREATRRYPPTIGEPNQGYGLGYALMGPPEDPGAVFGHGGYGGSLGLADARVDLAIGVAKTRMIIGGPTADRIVAEIRAAI
jgi:CubicO group peptidase (beta-lactamase class C family)